MSRKKVKQQKKGIIIWLILLLIAWSSNVEFSWLKTLLIDSAILTVFIMELARFLASAE